MTQRVEMSGTQRITYTQYWDAENRLVQVDNTTLVPNGLCKGCVSPVYDPIAKFIYDGDGNRVLQIQISGTQVTRAPHRTACGAVQVSPRPMPARLKFRLLPRSASPKRTTPPDRS